MSAVGSPVAALARPATLAEAMALLAEPAARPVAGGVGWALRRHAAPREVRDDVLVAVGHLPELRGIDLEAGGLRIGAAETLATVAEDDGIRRIAPLLSESAGVVATRRIRALVSLGGNLCALDPAHDPSCGLAASRAQIEVAGADGVRRLPASLLSAALRAGDLLLAVLLPRPAAHTGAAYVKHLPRGVWEYACVAVACRMRLEDERVAELDLAIGSAGPTAFEVPTEDLLPDTSGALAHTLAVRAAGLAEPVADVRGSADYKRRMVEVHVRRALVAAEREARA